MTGVPKVQVCVVFEVGGCTDKVMGIARDIRDAFPMLAIPEKSGALPPHMTILTGTVPVWDLQMAVARVLAEALPFSRSVLPVLGRVCLMPSAECVWLRLLFDRARGISSYVITGKLDTNWDLARDLGAPEAFSFSLPSHVTLIDLAHQARPYSNADALGPWLIEYERDHAGLLVKISEELTLLPHIYVKVLGGSWQLYQT